MIASVVLAAVAAVVPAAPHSGPASPAVHAKVATVAKPATGLQTLAPADEYFGSLKMSAIFIRARIGALARRYDARTESDDDLLHDAGDVRSALLLWAARYPRDAWLAPTALHLAQLYQDVQTEPARKLARDAYAYAANRYPGTTYGHAARARLAQGFPPLHAESPVVAASPSAPAGSGPDVAASPPGTAPALPTDVRPSPGATSTGTPSPAPASPGASLPAATPTPPPSAKPH